MKDKIKLMKGNEALAVSAIRYGCDGYFGYPITPQSEVLETLEAEMPWETTGMVVLQAESEVAARWAKAMEGIIEIETVSPTSGSVFEQVFYHAGEDTPTLDVAKI